MPRGTRGLHALEPRPSLDRGGDDLDARRSPGLGEGDRHRRAAQPGDCSASDTTFQPFTDNPSASYGLGLLGIGGFVGHWGMIFGYTTAMYYLPEDDATIVVLGNQSTNGSTAATEIFVEIARYLYPDRFPLKLGGSETTL